MRILVVTPYYKPAYIYGGPARSIPALCEGLSRCGAAVSVFTTNANGPGKAIAVPADVPRNIDGVEVRYFSVFWPLARLYPFYSLSLLQACRRHIPEFDVVYIAGNWTFPVWAAASCAEHTGTPYIISPRGSFMTWSMGEKVLKKRVYMALVERRIMDHAAAIHVTSLLERSQLVLWGFRRPVFTIPNGIDMSQFDHLPARGHLRQQVAIPADSTVSVFVGRLHKMKRLELIIESFSQVAQELPAAHLLVVGADQDGTGILAKKLVTRLSLSKQVHFLGPLLGGDLLEAYAEADLLVLLSHRENFGMVVLEAMAADVPVLLAEQVGLAEEIKQARAGLVVDANVDRVGRAWQKMLMKPSLRSAMARRAAALVSNRFEAGVVAAQMMDLFERVLAGTDDIT